jgi:hypothetical protein
MVGTWASREVHRVSYMHPGATSGYHRERFLDNDESFNT